MIDSKDKIAKNLLLDRTCDNCAFTDSHTCYNRIRRLLKAGGEYINFKHYPIENTCEDWGRV